MAKTLIRLVVAQAKEDDSDISQVSMRLWPKKQPTMEAWYRAGASMSTRKSLTGRGVCRPGWKAAWSTITDTHA